MIRSYIDKVFEVIYLQVFVAGCTSSYQMLRSWKTMVIGIERNTTFQLPNDPVTNRATPQDERSMFRLLMGFAFSSTISFSLYFYVHEVYILAYNGFFCLSLFLLFGMLSYFTSNLVWLFRLSVLTAFHAFYFEVFFTGGALSPALTAFIIPPIIAFFYKPVRDRYYFMVFALICAISIWILSILGITQDLFPAAHGIHFSMISALFVFGTVGLYIYLYRRTLNQKNRALRTSYLELQATSQKLIESEKMASLGVMSAGVAHEINNPLNFIKGGVEVLSRQLSQANDIKPYVQAINEGVSRASSIVSSLAHFSRATPSMEEVCDLHEVLDNCLIMLNHRLKYKVEVIKKYDEQGNVKIIGNEGKLHQAILNILSNAEQSIEERGTITISSYTESDMIRLTITDTGCGIAPEDMSKIRDPFFTTKIPGEGTGLGLSITYKVIEEHHGNISVESELGVGTSFHVTFNELKRSRDISDGNPRLAAVN